MALLFIGNRGALYYKDKMSEKKLWYKIEDSLYDEEEEVGEDLRRIRSHVKNEIEEEREEKYKQLEFEFDEDLVAPI
tara:strand:- start:169 stop:399 length:231 start_codon:yes stop_codon:yes gene_type:complete